MFFPKIQNVDNENYIKIDESFFLQKVLYTKISLYLCTLKIVEKSIE